MSSSMVLTQWVSGIDKLEHRKFEEIVGVVIHRIEVSQEDSSFTDSSM